MNTLDSLALNGGEKNKKQRLTARLEDILHAIRRIRQRGDAAHLDDGSMRPFGRQQETRNDRLEA